MRASSLSPFSGEAVYLTTANGALDRYKVIAVLCFIYQFAYLFFYFAPNYKDLGRFIL